MRVALGVDIGGTKVAVGAVGPDGGLVAPIRRYPSDTLGEVPFLEGLYAALRDASAAAAADGHEVAAIGLGCAGTVARDRGAIVVSPNLPLVDVPIARLVTEHVGVPVALDNDANVAVLAEARVGAAAGLRHVVMLTLGTGVGGGLVLDGRVFRGRHGAAAELGHTIVNAGGERCRCGAYGCLEAYASGTALERMADRLVSSGGRPPAHSGWRVVGRPESDVPGSVDIRPLAELRADGRLTGEAVSGLALAGDEAAGLVVSEVGAWLGVGASNLANIFDPEIIVVGGGLSALGESLLAPARRVVAAAALPPNREAPLVIAGGGADAGVVGAGILAWEELLGGESSPIPQDVRL